MDMHAFYVACLETGLSDLGIVSQIRLYGVRSDSTTATGIDVLQNYKMDAVSAAHINAERERQLVAFDFMVCARLRRYSRT